MKKEQQAASPKKKGKKSKTQKIFEAMTEEEKDELRS